MRIRTCSVCGERIEEHDRDRRFVEAVEHKNIWDTPGRSIRIPLGMGVLSSHSPEKIDEHIHTTMARKVEA